MHKVGGSIPPVIYFYFISFSIQKEKHTNKKVVMSKDLNPEPLRIEPVSCCMKCWDSVNELPRSDGCRLNHLTVIGQLSAVMSDIE